MQKQPLFFFILLLAAAAAGGNSLPVRNELSHHLAPSSEILKKQPRAIFVCPPHKGINHCIKEELPVDLQVSIGNILKYPKVTSYDVDARVIPIDFLFSSTGQIYHIGLGQAYATPVIYVDPGFEQNSQVLKHALYVIAQWEGMRAELELPPFLFRDWILKHQDICRSMAAKWNEEAYRRHNLKEMIARLSNAVDRKKVAKITLQFAGWNKDLSIGAGLQDLEAAL